MRDVSYLQHTPYFSNEEWHTLPLATRTSFVELLQSNVSSALLQPTATVLRWMIPVLVHSSPRLFVGTNHFPQLCWNDELGRSVEVQIMTDRIVWFIDGVCDDVDYL